MARSLTTIFRSRGRRHRFRQFHVRLQKARGADLEYPQFVVSGRSNFLDRSEDFENYCPYKFRRPPNVVANGVYQFRGGKNTRLEIKVDGASGMDYAFLGKTLPFDRVSARLLFTNDHLQISDVRADLLAGTLRGNADISLARNDPRYRATLSVSEINFPRLTDLYFNYKTAQGLLRGTYEFNGIGNDWRTMRGKGKVEVSNGDVFAIPIFGPLSGILNHIVPGSGYSIAHKADANSL